MGVKVKPNWGRSHPVSNRDAGQEFEYVRLAFERPTDVTLMLGNASDTLTPFQLIASTEDPYYFSWQAWYTIHANNGGTSNVIQGYSPVLGCVRHLVATSLVVRAVVPKLETDMDAFLKPRYAISAGIGRPTEQRSSRIHYAGGTFKLTEVRLNPWVHSVQLLASDGTTDFAAVLVQECEITGAGVSPPPAEPPSSSSTRPFAAFAQPVNLRPSTNMLRFYDPAGGEGGFVYRYFTLTQFSLL